jgi:hypothetical protein
MSGEDLKYLADRADTVRGRPDQRLAEVHARIRSARRRRAMGAVAGMSAAVVAVVVGIAILTGPAAPTKHNAPSPPANSDLPAPNTTRQLVYSDDLRIRPLQTSAGDGVPDILVGALHVGDREVEIDQKVLMSHGGWSLVVTDVGAAYVKVDHSVWFTDGGRPQQIAAHACADTSGDWRGLATGDAGTLVAWFDCSPASREDLVVYDTGLRDEVARQHVPSCRPPGRATYDCVADAIIGEHVYFGHINSSGRLVKHQYMLDVSSGQVSPAGPAVYADDLRTHPRALVIGDSWRAGTATNETGHVVFTVVGSRLVPVIVDDGSGVTGRTQAFDTATRKPVRLRLPTGYHPDPAAGFHAPGERLEGTDTFTPFLWLDDDTVALAQGGIGDILTCHLSDGHCDLAVKQPPHNRPRIAPGLGLPG